MREILFRGKGSQKDYVGRWIEGGYDFVGYSVDDAVIWTKEPCRMGVKRTVGYHVTPNTVGQYTGIKDKNGVKIFEGDIVRRHEEPFGLTDVGVVVYNEAIGSFRLHVEKNGTTTRYDFVTSDIYNDGYCHVECKATFEVIGNKFDNPELLEGGSK